MLCAQNIGRCVSMSVRLLHTVQAQAAVMSVVSRGTTLRRQVGDLL